MSLDLPASVELELQQYAESEHISPLDAAVHLIQKGLKSSKRKARAVAPLTDDEIRQLDSLGKTFGLLADHSDEVIDRMAATINRMKQERFSGSPPVISEDENVMGGDACIRATRIPVWMLVGYKQAGMTDHQILANFPGLNASDLIASWDYFASHSERILAERRAHEEAT
jgi:uncharacterized protein (DUF433 family)